MSQDTIAESKQFAECAVTVFMLVKTMPEWLGLSGKQRMDLFHDHVKPVLMKYKESVKLRLYDVEFYSARVTDLWMWEALDHRAYERLVDDLRDTPFWDRYFAIIEILPAVENIA